MGSDQVSFDGSPLRPLASHPPPTNNEPQTQQPPVMNPSSPLEDPDPDEPPPTVVEKQSAFSKHSTQRYAMSLRRHLGAALGEFLGTTSFLFMAFGAVAVASMNAPDAAVAATDLGLIGFNLSRLFYVSLAFGLAYMVNVWAFFHVSEGFFNPAVSSR